MNCELCAFENPKGTATAVIMKDNKLLMLKRNQEPFKNCWDLPGGYMNKGETPEKTLKRELKEELNVDCDLTFIATFSGVASYNDKEFPVVSHTYLATIEGEIKLDGENSEYKYFPLNEIQNTAFDSNQEIVRWVQNNFNYNLNEVRELVKQLDSSAVVDEQALYKAVIKGHVTAVKVGGKLVGMGWIFPRQTMLRHQAVIEDMIVDENYRGQGFGKTILLQLLDWAKENKVEVVELTSGWYRKAAHALYLKHGFKIHDTAHMLNQL